MKCPKCGGSRMKRYRPSPLDWDVKFGNSRGACPDFMTYCFACCIAWTDEQTFEIVRSDIKPKGKSEAAKVVFG